MQKKQKEQKYKIKERNGMDKQKKSINKKIMKGNRRERKYIIQGKWKYICKGKKKA